MSRELQPPVPISLVEIEHPTEIKNEPPESEIVEIGIDDILDSSESEEEIIPDVKGIDIVYHPVCEQSIKNEILESKHCESVETRLLVKAENYPFIKTENITQRIKTEDTSDENVTKGTGQGVVEIQASNEHSNALSNLEIDVQSVLNFSKDLNSISVRSRSPKKTDFAECYKTDDTTSWKKEKEKIKVIKAPLIPVEAHEYISLDNDRHVCNHCQKTYKKVQYLKNHIKRIHREVTTMYQCPYCPDKLIRKYDIKQHIIRKHKDIKNIQWFQCNLCEVKFKLKSTLTRHMTVHLTHEQMQDGLDLKRCWSFYPTVSSKIRDLKFRCKEEINKLHQYLRSDGERNFYKPTIWYLDKLSFLGENCLTDIVLQTWTDMEQRIQQGVDDIQNFIDFNDLDEQIFLPVSGTSKSSAAAAENSELQRNEGETSANMGVDDIQNFIDFNDLDEQISLPAGGTSESSAAAETSEFQRNEGKTSANMGVDERITPPSNGTLECVLQSSSFENVSPAAANADDTCPKRSMEQKEDYYDMFGKCPNNLEDHSFCLKDRVSA